MKNIRVVLADDHAGVRAYIRQILLREGGIEIVGEASNGVEAIYLVNHFSPDVLLLDMEMPVLGGVEVVRELCKVESPVQILALSAYDDKHYILEVLAYGASGYLTKDEAPQYIVEAVCRVAEGEQGWFSQRVAEQLATWIQQENQLS
jgi:DNA-binding NarL/FixJ family response regulator